MELYNTKDVETNWGLKFKKDLDIDSPIGCLGGIFRKEESGDQHLQHIIIFNSDDVDYQTFYNCSDPDNPIKAKKSDTFALDCSVNGGLVKFVNSTCVKNKVNVKLYSFKSNGQWHCEYWTTKKVEHGDIVLSDIIG